MGELNDPTVWLPLVFAGLMGLSILIYVILDGYDLGIGMLMIIAEEDEKDRMIASIGPFWDANETWLVLAVGLLLVAFPAAHGTILTALYLPVALMLIGLILRGVAFDFRAKVSPPKKPLWNTLFFLGSLIAALSQGFMLGMYVMGLDWTLNHVLFSGLIACCLAAAYMTIGSTWLIYKMENALQKKAVTWAKRALIFTAIGMGAISLATPLVSSRIFDKWFSFPEILALAPLPIGAGALFLALVLTLRKLPKEGDRHSWLPLILTGGIFVMGFLGLAYSFYPYVVPEKLTIYEAAAAPESLLIILFGTLFVLPVILIYTAFAYSVFRGKATDLRYD
ncbi:MAG: cytochrome d ubiquinol oxidase subunit II [Alphaproteobacteria bacterium]|nr:cytochrome d ubiquinol oxidase subunit II [Alphaproteobacteria bacterium]